MKKYIRIFLLFIFIYLVINSLFNVNRIYIYSKSDQPATVTYMQGKHINTVKTSLWDLHETSKLKLKFSPAINLGKFSIKIKTNDESIEIEKLKFLMYFVNVEINSKNFDQYLTSNVPAEISEGNIIFKGLKPIELNPTDKFLDTFRIIKYLTEFLISLVLLPIVILIFKLITLKTHHIPTEKIQNRIVASLFCLILVLPNLANFLSIKNDNAMDNRNLAKAPVLTIKNLPQFTTEYENYFNDNFGFRTELIRAYFYLKYKLFKSSTLSMQNEKAYFGKDGFIFYKADKEYEDVQAKAPFTNNELASIRRNIIAESDYLKSKNIKFYIVIAPNKSTIYNDKLPVYVKYSESKQHRTDQFIDLLTNIPDINIIDLRAPLFDAKKNNQVYYKTDTHWNDIGSFYGYQAIMNKIKIDYPNLTPISYDDFEEGPRNKFSGDLTPMLGLSDFISEDAQTLKYKRKISSRQISDVEFPSIDKNVDVLKYENRSSNAPRIVIFRDSFFRKLTLLFAETFKDTTCVWQYKIDNEVVKKEKPDIVILEVAERYIGNL